MRFEKGGWGREGGGGKPRAAYLSSGLAVCQLSHATALSYSNQHMPLQLWANLHAKLLNPPPRTRQGRRSPSPAPAAPSRPPPPPTLFGSERGGTTTLRWRRRRRGPGGHRQHPAHTAEPGDGGGAGAPGRPCPACPSLPGMGGDGDTRGHGTGEGGVRGGLRRRGSRAHIPP